MNLKKIVSTAFLTLLLISLNQIGANATSTVGPDNKNVKALFNAIASSDPDKIALAQKYVVQNSSADYAITMIDRKSTRLNSSH